MKKSNLLCLIVAFLLALWGCSDAPLVEPSTAITSTTAQPTTENTTAPKPRERHEYNKHNPDKNLFLQFLHDEIPVVNMDGSEKTFYFSDLSEVADEDRKIFYIVDMDGDGKPELCCKYQELAAINIMRYNEEKDCFDLWLSGLSQQFPLGNGEMYIIGNSWTSYHLYDENANLIEEIVYSFNRGPDVKFWIDKNGFQKEVAEDDWNSESAWLFELIENAPKPISYKELYTP